MAIDFTALNNACVLYYSMDNADVSGSTILDLTPNNNDGTINGATTGTAGILNEALSFDGINDNIPLSNSYFAQPGEDFSYCTWFKSNSISKEQVVVGRNGWFSTTIVLNRANSNEIRVVIREPNGNTLEQVLSIDVTQWNFACNVADATNSEFRVYINGNQIGSSIPWDGTYDQTSFTPHIGGRVAGNDRYFDGEIDEVSMFNKALTLEEHRFLYNLGAPTVNQQYPFSPNVTYAIEGQVTLSGTATQGATLRLYDQTGSAYEGSTTTDVNGNYLFDYLTDGNEYHVSVEYDDGTNKYNDESKPYIIPYEKSI